MKSERRHELQTNSLVRGVQNLPNFWRESGSKISLAIIAVLLVFVLVRLWYTSRNEKAARLAGDLTDAQAKLTELKRSTDLWLSRASSRTPEEFHEYRKAVLGAISNSTDDVLKNSSDPAQQAEAKLIRADLSYYMAEMGAMPEATTRPQFQLDKKPPELVDAALHDYGDVAGKAEGLPAALVARAHFGLAAIAEDRGEWPKARTEYEAVAKTPGTPQAMIDLANRRMELLSKIEVPVLFGDPRRLPETRPAFEIPGPGFFPGPPMPSTTPATSPGTQPATGPVTLPLAPEGPAPAPAPATQPAGTQPGAAASQPATTTRPVAP